MQGFEVKFNIYAESQEEADAVSNFLREFVNDHSRRGIAVTAAKLQEAFRHWGDSPLVRNRIEHFLK